MLKQGPKPRPASITPLLPASNRESLYAVEKKAVAYTFAWGRNPMGRGRQHMHKHREIIAPLTRVGRGGGEEEMAIYEACCCLLS